MKFGPVAIGLAEGGILAHSLTLPGKKLAKGRRLSREDCAFLRVAGIEEVTVARLEADDLGEDDAATFLSRALVPDPEKAGIALTPAHTGRVNLKASRSGLFLVDAGRLLHANAVDPAITVATLPPMARVVAGQIVGTVKIITYSVDRGLLARAAAHAAGATTVQGVRVASASLILTDTPGSDEKLIRKGRSAIATRLKSLGIDLKDVRTVPHRSKAVAEAIADAGGEIVLILTAAATSDVHDVAPEGLRLAGGTVDRFGMPVDPGNLLFLGQVGSRAVIGLPGCSRSLALNGADWVLERVACGLTPSTLDFAAMGVGGLLKDVASRGRMRNADEADG